MSALTSNRVFSLSCSGPGGTASDTVNITVTAPSPTLSFSQLYRYWRLVGQQGYLRI
jgi:hypothetical protein